MAALEMLVILALVPQAYEFPLMPGHAVGPDALITLRPNHGVLVPLHLRHTSA